MSKKFPLSDHYDGSKFHNLDANADTDKGLISVLRWKMGSKPVAWPEVKIADLATPQISAPLQDNDLRITFVNHATVLIQWKSINIITDPVFSEKLGPMNLLNIKRYRDVGIQFENLPKIDFVFISHNHYDHLDLPSIAKLEQRDAPTYIVPLGVKDYMPEKSRARVQELDWWQSFKKPQLDLEIIFAPSQHWSKRSLTDTNTSLWGAAIFKSHGRSVYFGGDTGYAAHFKMTEEKLGPMDVALLPIGAYEPRWFMKASHMNPDDAVQAHKDLKSGTSIGIHFGTFKLTDEGIDEPAVDLKKSLAKNSIAAKDFQVPQNGQTFIFKGAP